MLSKLKIIRGNSIHCSLHRDRVRLALPHLGHSSHRGPQTAAGWRKLNIKGINAVKSPPVGPFAKNGCL
jgi:hypothetical protein